MANTVRDDAEEIRRPAVGAEADGANAFSRAGLAEHSVDDARVANLVCVDVGPQRQDVAIRVTKMRGNTAGPA